jgi:predicted transcriptional regulator
MTSNPVSVTPTCCAIDALLAMFEGDFRQVPVIMGGRICGVVSHRDFRGLELDEFIPREVGRAIHSAVHRGIREIVQNDKPFVLASDKTVTPELQSHDPEWQVGTGGPARGDIRGTLLVG